MNLKNPIHTHDDHDEQFLHKKMELLLNLFKLLFYIAIAGGIIWNLAYYSIIVGVLPDLDSSNLLGYLFAIFGIGLFYVVAINLVFIIPGSVFYKAQQNNNIEKVSFRKPILFKVYLIITCALTLLLLFAGNLINTYSIIGSAVLIIAVILQTKKVTRDLRIAKIVELMPESIKGLIEIFNKFILKTRISENLNQKTLLGKGIISIFLFLFITVSFALGISNGVAIETKDKFFGIFTFFITLVVASFTNFVIAEKGIDFAKVTKNTFLNTIISFSLISLFLIFFFFYISILTDKTHPYLTIPYRALKIGSFYTTLTLEEKYVEQILVEKTNGSPPESNKEKFNEGQTKYCFEVLSSVGKEYIVKLLSDKECKPPDSNGSSKIGSNDNKKQANIKDISRRQEQLDKTFNTNKTNYDYILRIPKDKVLLVEYIEKRNSK